ncbi:hypothetical protein ANCDUO_24571, partial [Ancylostoma duodenale]
MRTLTFSNNPPLGSQKCGGVWPRSTIRVDELSRSSFVRAGAFDAKFALRAVFEAMPESTGFWMFLKLKVDYEIEAKRRRGMPEYDEVERRLQNLIIRVDESIVEKLVSDLQEKLETEDYQHAMYIITFLCDLGNSRVLTLSSIIEFLEGLLQAAFEENVPQARTDWFVYVVLRVMPWIGLELSEKKKDELDNILEGAGKYIEGRRKVHVK